MIAGMISNRNVGTSCGKEGPFCVRQGIDVWILDISVDINIDQSPEVRRHIQNILRFGPKVILVNLSGVSYLDTSGLSTLVEAVGMAQRRGTCIGFFGLNTKVRGLMQVTKLENILRIFKDEHEALRSAA